MIAKVRYLAAAALAVCAFVNLGRFIEIVYTFPPRQSDDRVVWDRRLIGIRDTLLAEHFTSGNIGYMPAGVLQGRKRTEREDVDWVQVRYAMIPLNVLQDSLDAPYVIAETSHAIEGFEMLYDARNGWILLKKK